MPALLLSLTIAVDTVLTVNTQTPEHLTTLFLKVELSSSKVSVFTKLLKFYIKVLGQLVRVLFFHLIDKRKFR